MLIVKFRQESPLDSQVLELLSSNSSPHMSRVQLSLQGCHRDTCGLWEGQLCLALLECDPVCGACLHVLVGVDGPGTSLIQPV